MEHCRAVFSLEEIVYCFFHSLKALRSVSVKIASNARRRRMIHKKPEVGALGAAAAVLGKIVNPVSKSLMLVSSTISMVMPILMIIDILSRVFFNAPITGLMETEMFMLAVLFFCGLAFTTSENGHVSVDVLLIKFKPNLKRFLGAVFSLLGLSLFSIISWQYVVRAIEAFHKDEVSLNLSYPLYPFFLLTSFGCAMAAAVLIKKSLENIDDLLKSFGRARLGAFMVFFTTTVILFAPRIMKMLQFTLNPTSAGIVFLLFMLVLMLMGFPVAFAMGLTGFVGTWYLTDSELALSVLRMSAYEAVSNYFFCVLPFFILMGFLCMKAGISVNLYSAAHDWFGQLPGGLAIGTVVGCGGFAAICGDSMATAATIGSVSLPEMKKYKYRDSLATGAVAAGGTLGILIPPSLGFIIYGLITEESVGKLFMAGVIPGVLLVTLFSICIYLRCKLDPTLGPRARRVPFSEKFTSLIRIWPVAILFGLVIGGIYLGFFTPTEAGAVGVIGALIIGLISRNFSWKSVLDALFTSMKITAMIFTILIGVEILGYFVALTEVPLKLAGFITTLSVSRYVTYGLILLVYLILGMVMNIVPMIMLTLPILFPTVVSLGFDPIWFGVIMVMMMEMGQITPPVGINVFVISGVAGDVPLSTIFRGIFPFVVVEVILIIILTIFPQIALVLPNAMEVLPDIGG
jgi:tripartite ATP-independent transporter DctM subunit